MSLAHTGASAQALRGGLTQVLNEGAFLHNALAEGSCRLLKMVCEPPLADSSTLPPSLLPLCHHQRRSLDVAHLCVNGMSYSSRGSPWANSAVVVTVGASHGDFDDLRGALPPALAGLEWQETMEERAAKMGGGQFKCPVQRVSDFLAGRPSAQEDLPESSYRLGVTAASLHELYPPAITDALRQGIAEFGQSMPGFDSSEGLLHAVETRTSAPVQVVRREDTCEAIGLRGLYPAGEGAGYAGGIVSAAVDGLRVAKALLKHVGGRRKAFERTLGDAEEALLSPPPI